MIKIKTEGSRRRNKRNRKCCLPQQKEEWMKNRQFKKWWTLQYFFVEVGGNWICLICEEKLAIHKESNLKRHCAAKHRERYENYKEDDRKKERSSNKKN